MKLTPLKNFKCFFLCVMTGFLIAACAGGAGDGTSDQVGTISVSLTDNAGLYNAVVLSIEKVGVVTSNSATTYYNSDDISELPVTIDVLDLPNEATLFLGDIEVPLPDDGSEVCFNQFRLVLAEQGNYVIENGDPDAVKHDLKTPSGQQSGVKLLVQEEAFCLNNEDDAVNITIEFDPETAIIVKENSANPYQLKPTSMRIIEGNFFTAPESFINGEVRVPVLNVAGSCQVLATNPIAKIAAYADNDNNHEVPTSKTVALTEGPINDGNSCYYSGGFKLLLPDQGSYDLLATWDTFNAEMPSVTFNSTVLMKLTD